MRGIHTATAVTLFILAVGSVPAGAKKNPSRPFYLPTPVTMDGAEIPQGMYQLNLMSNKSDVRVELWRDGRFMATARGAWVKSGVKYKENTILLRVNPDGSRSLIELRLSGAAKSIVLTNNTDDKIQYSAK
jgi:hypothetical protein